MNPVLKMVKELAAQMGGAPSHFLALQDGARVEAEPKETEEGNVPNVTVQPVFLCMPTYMPNIAAQPVLMPTYSVPDHMAAVPQQMSAATLHQEAQRAQLAAAALRAHAAMQQEAATQHQSAPTAKEASSGQKMRPYLESKSWQQPSPQAGPGASPMPADYAQAPSAAALMLEAQRSQLAAASLRAQVRLEAGESYTKQRQFANDVVVEEAEAVSLMFRNLPLDLTRDMFVSMVDNEGFAGQYDFIYLPLDFKTGANLGYAFVNLLTHHDARHMQQHFYGFCRWSARSAKKCEASWSSTQGLTAYINRYRNNPVMHESVPEEAKPMLFERGARASFPGPSRKVKAPRQ